MSEGGAGGPSAVVFRTATALLVALVANFPLTVSSASEAASIAGSPQSATRLSATDATNDVVPVNDCHADITAYGGDYAGTSISVGDAVVCGSNPNSDPHWTTGLTGTVWAIDVNGDNQSDFDVFFLNLGGLQASVNLPNSSHTKVCDAVPSWDGAKSVGANFAASCIGSPPSFRVQAFMLWDDNPGQASCKTCPRDWAPSQTTFSANIPLPGFHTACDRTDKEPGAFADAGLAADCLKAYGIALGKGDGTFGENEPLRRSQVSSLLARLLTTNGIPLNATRSFPDVNANTVPDAKVRDEIEHLAGGGIIAGFPDQTFGPAGTLSVAQATTFVMRTLQLIHSQRASMPNFRDQGSTAANYNYAIDESILDASAADINGARYGNGASDANKRGLLADMLAQSLERLGKVFYATCAEAKSAGATPLHRGDAGYRPALDPDGDGTACETA
jgi:hypothetical protein